MRNASSVKDRLKNYAKRTGRTVQDALTVYILERVLYRISVSRYADDFTLKGGILLYGLYSDDFTRATTDIDLLGEHISNDLETLKSVFREILNTEADDPIRFDMNTLDVVNITEFKKYHGARVTVTSYLDRTRIRVGIDIGFGDVVYPNRQTMNYPTLLDDDPVELYAYSVYSIVTEKMEAIVSLGVVNSRYKDFYDLATISEREDLDGHTLQESLIETFDNRRTTFDYIAAFEDDFINDYSHQQRWKGFLNNKRVTSPLSFEETMNEVKHFILPVINAIRDDKPFSGHWNHISREWE
jgi:predicted nucleotidyltransferase component of viral defense system